MLWHTLKETCMFLEEVMRKIIILLIEKSTLLKKMCGNL